MAARAMLKHERIPQCANKTGAFLPKQCDDSHCWCVNPKNGACMFDGLKVPFNETYDCTGK